MPFQQTALLKKNYVLICFFTDIDNENLNSEWYLNILQTNVEGEIRELSLYTLQNMFLNMTALRHILDRSSRTFRMNNLLYYTMCQF